MRARHPNPNPNPHPHPHPNQAALALAALASGGVMSGSEDTCSLHDACSTKEWPTGRRARGEGGRGEEASPRSSHTSDLDFIAEELEAERRPPGLAEAERAAGARVASCSS